MTIFEVSEDQAIDYGRLCTRCQGWCFWEEFSNHTDRRDGKRGDCRKCENGDKRISAKNIYHADPSNKQKARLAKYKLTEEQYQNMLEDQEHRCAWCGRHESEFRQWDIDHDRECCPTAYTCGKCVRRLLCHGCNTTEGSLRRIPGAVAAVDALSWYNNRETFQ